SALTGELGLVLASGNRWGGSPGRFPNGIVPNNYRNTIIINILMVMIVLRSNSSAANRFNRRFRICKSIKISIPCARSTLSSPDIHFSLTFYCFTMYYIGILEVWRRYITDWSRE
ncbi:MAG: hypothetical protein JW795_00560, partial [Chitinivibrionales bacterium]|nr:hypothetical protein [Chitinivibrionales bacterium]